MHIDIKSLVRKNILSLTPYSSARHEFKGAASIFLDANENPYGSPVEEKYNRYPDTAHALLKLKLAALNQVAAEQIGIGNGSDELIDQLIRIFCHPGVDEIIVCPPTFKMYEVAAAINDVRVIRSYLDDHFQPLPKDILKQATSQTRILFLCSPNNPTGNSIKPAILDELLNHFHGMIVLDEAYIHFSPHGSLIDKIKDHPNLIILQTMSKAWGLAGLRLGVAYANPAVIEWIMRVKMPYNVNTVSQILALQALDNREQVVQWRDEILQQRLWMESEFRSLDFIETIYPSDANFVLIRVKDAAAVYQHLCDHGIIIRNQSSQHGLHNCLRVTVGTPAENKKLIQELKNYMT